MPKLDATFTVERLRKRLEELQAGVEVANRDLRAVLTDVQQAALDAALLEQDALRASKRARSKDEQTALGWKTKREVRIEILTQALACGRDNELNALLDRQRSSEIRQTKIYFEALKQAELAGMDKRAAEILANNALTRASLPRMDGQRVDVIGASRRDKEVWAMEEALLAQFKKDMSVEEIEQAQLVAEHDKAVQNKGKPKGKLAKD
jgi:hypothetical protein